jgi:hypothetical protein
MFLGERVHSYFYGFGPSCGTAEYRLATPQSVILPSWTRIASTVSNATTRPAGAMPRNVPCWGACGVGTRQDEQIGFGVGDRQSNRAADRGFGQPRCHVATEAAGGLRGHLCGSLFCWVVYWFDVSLPARAIAG